MEVKMEKVKEFYAENKPYRPPKQVNADDPADIQDLDEIKLHELKEVRQKIVDIFVRFGYAVWVEK